MAPLHKPQLLFDVLFFYGRGKPHGLGLSPPSQPPPPRPPPHPLLTQLASSFQHTLTKHWVSLPSRNDNDCVHSDYENRTVPENHLPSGRGCDLKESKAKGQHCTPSCI